MERRLAAIPAADVAGYSRLIGADEEGTLSLFKAIRADLFDRKIADHRGRIVKTTGDGLLVEFSSVVDALRCATEVQAGMSERNAPIPTDLQIHSRIGINVGDVVEDEDIFGDGVNIAARLEGLAAPGEICVSARVKEDAAGKVDVAFEDLGEQHLHNIIRPVRVYRIGAGVAPRVTLPLPDKPSIAVLAFTNMSGDSEQEFFADGIAEDIITVLSKSRLLFVIARNSSFTYKGKAVAVPEIGRELGVRYVLEGSVRKAGARVRVTAQFIDATTGGIFGRNGSIATLPTSFLCRTRLPRAFPGRFCRQWSEASANARRASPRTASTPGRAITAGCGISRTSNRPKTRRLAASSGARSSSIRDSPRRRPPSL
ncbi:MAG TPA: adenylate/guanylate cyclase domain-containing protein [Stellaceae bacterium]|nr:adenylate/guanylate cyclase domain-containing protein [Stellaceae bacterium]